MLLEFFKLAEIIFKKLQFINVPTIHFVILEIFKLANKLKKPSSEGGIPKRMSKFGEFLLESLSKKYVGSISTAHIMSLFLHPNYKKSMSNFNSFGTVKLDCSMATIYSNLELHSNYINELSSNYQTAKNHPVERASPKKIKIEADEFMDLDTSNSDEENASLTKELNEYFEMKIKTIYENPLEFWQLNQKKFPNLSSVAKSLFAIPASSSEAERHCSTAGLAMTELRSSLSPKNLENLVILNEYLKNL